MKISLTKNFYQEQKIILLCQTVVPLVIQTDQLLIQRKVSTDFQVIKKRNEGLVDGEN